MTPLPTICLLFLLGASTSPARQALPPPEEPRTSALELTVDATDAPRGRFRMQMWIPVVPGPLTLAYPKWIQGEHGPYGPTTQMAGLRLSAGGKNLPWRRDPLEMFLFHLQVPPGADRLLVEFDYLSPVRIFGPSYGKTPNATPHLMIVDWHNLLLYPYGASADGMAVQAHLRLPAGWQSDSALTAKTAPDGNLTFERTTLTTLIDSPVLAGDHFRTEILEAGDHPTILSVAADRASALNIPPGRLVTYRNLPREALALFGARHYRSYHWLLALGDTLDENGLEHHESTDIRGPLSYFTNPTTLTTVEFTLAHEYAHSWNGKFRRPAGMTPRDPQQPLDDELLWVYEGLTRYLDLLLTARSGMRSPELSRDYLAWRAGRQDRARPGRAWRPLVDTAISAQDLATAADDWTSYRRSHKDYYDESMLIWLDADTLIQEQTSGKRSLDDFCRAFFGGADSPPRIQPYTREDVEAALGRLAPYDWHAFFTSRIYEIAPRTPLDGIARAGWKLVYEARPNAFQQAWDATNKQLDHTFSLGLLLDPTGLVKDVVLDSAAWKAGFAPGMKIISIHGKAWAPDILEEELTAIKQSALPLAIGALHGEELRDLRVDWHAGVLYPRLERDTAKPDLLSRILEPRTKP